MKKTYYSDDGRVYFYIDKEDLFILNRGLGLTFKVIKKLNISVFLAKAYDIAKEILDIFYDLSNKYTSKDNYISTCLDMCSNIDSDNEMLMDSSLTFTKMQLIFNVLVDFSEDNPILCHPTYTKKYNHKSFDRLSPYISTNYESMLVCVDNKIVNVVSTYDYTKFIIYLCYTTDKSVKRFKICPGCYESFIDGTITKYFRSDIDKSRYSRMTKQDVVLNEYKSNLNSLFLFLKYNTSKEDKDKMKDAIFEFIQLTRPTIYKLVRWDKLTKSNKGIYSFSESNNDDKTLLNDYKRIALSNWSKVSSSFALTNYIIDFSNKIEDN